MSFTVKFVQTETTEDTEHYKDEDAYLFLPGGVLGVWVEKDRRSNFHPPGVWLHVSGKDHPPGHKKSGINGERQEVLELRQPGA